MLNWGLIGAGEIARVFANGLRFSQAGRVVAVASQTPGKSASLAADFGIPKHYASYEALLADREVAAVYISTIHPFHARWTIEAARAGKHVLVEKPMAMNHTEAAAMLQAARANDVFMMEAFMYRCHPQTQKLAEMVRSGAVGKVKLIRSTFSFAAAYNPASRLFAKEKGGGGILDVGCYPVSMTRLLAGAALGKPFANPISLKAAGVIGPTGVDHYAAATMEFEDGIIAQIICGVDCEMPRDAGVYGEKGWLSVSNPWLPSSPCRDATMPLPLDTHFPTEKIIFHPARGQEPQEIAVPADRDLYTYEADMVAEHIADRQAPVMSWDDSLGNMALLDQWRREVGAL
jgi:predicted dehydrogenase